MSGLIQVTCPACIERAAGFLVPASKNAECLRWSKEDRGVLTLARGTLPFLSQDWRQRSTSGKRVAVWRVEHNISCAATDAYYDDRTSHHIAIRNPQHGRSDRVWLCNAPDQIALGGPGASAHIAADAEAISARDSKERFDEVSKAREDARSREAAAFCAQIVAAFAALGFKVSAGGGFMGHHFDSISLDPDDAAKIIDAMGGAAPRKQVDPMPVWSVHYGDDKDPMLLGARTEAGAKAWMMSHYCDERRDEGDNVPLDPDKLHIELVEDPPEPMADEDAA